MQHQYNADEIGYIASYKLNDGYTGVSRYEIEVLAKAVRKGNFKSDESIIHFVKVVKEMLVRLNVDATWSNEHPMLKRQVSKEKTKSETDVDERISLMNLLVDLSRTAFYVWNSYTMIIKTWGNAYADVDDYDDLHS